MLKYVVVIRDYHLQRPKVLSLQNFYFFFFFSFWFFPLLQTLWFYCSIYSHLNFHSIKNTIMILSSDEHQTHQKNFNFHSLHPKLDSMSIGSSRSNLASPLHFQQRAARVASPLPFQQPYVPYGSSHQVSSAVTTHTRFNGFHRTNLFVKSMWCLETIH